MTSRLAPGRVLAVAGALLVGCGEKPTEPVSGMGTIRGIPLLEAGKVVTGSIIAGGTNSFLIDLTPRVDWRLFLQATSGRAADTLVATVSHLEVIGIQFGQVWSIGTDTSLDDRATAPLDMWAPVRRLVTVHGRSADDSGSYRIVLRAPDPRPERASASVVVGDTVSGEAIDRYGDVDEFTFSGAAGDEMLVFLQPLTSDATGSVRLLLLDSAGVILGDVSTEAVRRSLEEFSTSLRLPSTGVYRLRILGAGSWRTGGMSWRGAYRFQVYRVNRAPERAAASVALGDTIAESIDGVGDIDEFSFTAAAGKELHVNFALARRLASELRLEVLQGQSTLAQVTTRGRQTSLDEIGTGRFLLPATGTYTVRVSGATAGSPDSTTVAYRFELYVVDRRPEAIGSVVAIGDTVRGETIGRLGDVDEYSVAANAGDELNIFLSAISADPGEQLMLEVAHPDGSPIRRAFAGRQDAEPEGATNRFSVTQTGTYSVRVVGIGVSTAAYSFEIYRINRAPETAAGEVPVGVKVRESFDRPGDVDEFTFEGTAGQEMNIFLTRGTGMIGAGFLTVDGLFVRAVTWEGATGVFTLPETKTYRMRVSGDVGGSAEGAVGPYDLLVFPIDRAPEVLNATFAIGDTVVGESIDPAGDIDEFVVDGTAGESLRILFEASHEGAPRHFSLIVRNDRTKERVSGVASNRTEPTLGDFTLPSTDRYRVTVATLNSTSIATDVGAFRFALVRRP